MATLREIEPADPQAANALRTLAESSARMGGKLALQSFGKPLRIEWKEDGSEVTDVDRGVERAIVAHIRAARPQDEFIGEETLGFGGRSEAKIAPDQIVWVIDPIDGTRNFVRGAPLFACSVAVLRAGEPIAGAIYDPLRDEMFSAAVANGARLGSRRLNLESFDPPTRSATQRVVAIPSARDAAAPDAVHAIVRDHVVRNLGCTTLHMAYVAAGRFDAALKTTCRLWDIAAGALLIREAGGVCTRLDGSPLFPIDTTRYSGEKLPCLSASRPAHGPLLDLIRGNLPDN
ncbi:MAG: inositol monophosphatase [Planctomycetota bacterium]|nr:MAG: inositol monophosphatase [Planctomycetota bacterium]